MRWASPDALGILVYKKKPYNCSSKIYWGGEHWRFVALPYGRAGARITM